MANPRSSTLAASRAASKAKPTPLTEAQRARNVELKAMNQSGSRTHPFIKGALSSYTTAFGATPLERIDMIRRGIPAADAKRLFADLMGQTAALKALRLPAATVNKKAKQGATLSPEESERVIGFAKLLGQVESMVDESGDPTGFDAAAWLTRWLTDPLPAFGGLRPADFVDTMEGQAMVSAMLARMQSGAYA